MKRASNERVAELLAAARGPGSPAELRNLPVVLQAYRDAAPYPVGDTVTLPPVAPERISARWVRRLAAAGLATKVALATGAALATVASSIAVTAVVEHDRPHPVAPPPTPSVSAPHRPSTSATPSSGTAPNPAPSGSQRRPGHAVPGYPRPRPRPNGSGKHRKQPAEHHGMPHQHRKATGKRHDHRRGERMRHHHRPPPRGRGHAGR